MALTSVRPIGLDACWQTTDLVKSIEKCSKEGGVASRLTAGGLTGLVALTALANAVMHFTRALVELPMIVVITVRRLVGMSTVAQSDYNLKRAALHVVRALAFAAEGAICGTIGIPFAVVKPSVIVSLHRDLRLDVSWEASVFSQRWIGRIGQCCDMAQSYLKGAWERLYKADPVFTVKVVGALEGVLAVAGIVWIMSRPAPEICPKPEVCPAPEVVDKPRKYKDMEIYDCVWVPYTGFRSVEELKWKEQQHTLTATPKPTGRIWLWGGFDD